MKVLVVLCAVVASCLAKPGVGYVYSAISPLTSYSSIAAPYTYAYSAPIISAAPLAAPYAVPAAPIAPIAPIAPVAAAVKTQYHSQDELGQASYGHSEPFQAHSAVQDAAGNKVGSYSYVDPHGAVHQTNYVADSLGYRVAANDLPVAPAGPGPVVPAETPEVVAAKAAHFAEHAAALSRARRSAYWAPHAIPVVTPSGHLADTPEVAAAKAAHFAEHARQSGHAVAVPYAAHYAAHYTGHYAGPYAAPVVTPSGHLADTPEVAAAKAAHFAEHAKASGHAVAAVPYYSGAYAAPVVTPSGHLADTPEVAAAKAAHFAEHAKQAGVAPVVPYSAYHAGHYAGPYATPVVTPSGHLADTPEVAAAKAAHFAEHAKQGGHAAYAVPYAAGHYAGYTGYAGPYAAPVVTPSGFLADTPEVAAAKHAHLAEHARRGKRSLFYQTPASTSPLAAPIVPAPAVTYAAPAVAYAAPAVSYAAPAVAYSAPALGVPAIRTDIVHTPGHAVSYRIDPISH